jgi:electron transfer flavoprotein alpha subunit
MTTGVVVDPRLYVAFAISGAVQHTSGLGQPDHIVSVNLDAHCPMMQLADLAVVSDANGVLDELAARLGLPGNGSEIASDNGSGRAAGA